MEKLKFLPLGLVCLYTLKVLALGAQLPDSIALLGLIFLSGFSIYKESDREYKRLEEKITELHKELALKTSTFDEMRNKVNAMAVASNFKQVNRG